MADSKPLISDPLLVHEGSLTRKVGLGSEAADIVDQQLHHLGTQLVSQLNVLLRTVRSHGGSNTALDRPVAVIRRLIEALGYEQPVELRVQEGFVFLGQRHLKTTTAHMPLYSSFIDALAAIAVGGLVFKKTATEAALRKFAELFVAIVPSDDGVLKLRENLKAAGISNVALELPRGAHKEDIADGAVM